MQLRVGHGFDAHRFSSDDTRKLVLGGVVVQERNGLVGHSDADALFHSITDAILGAIGEPDIGSHFSDTDEHWKDADSSKFLQHAVQLATSKGWQIQNIDCTLLAEVPKIAPHRNEMIVNASHICGAPVNIKATRAEEMGAIGRKEGIACWAVALLSRAEGEIV